MVSFFKCFLQRMAEPPQDVSSALVVLVYPKYSSVTSRNLGGFWQLLRVKCRGAQGGGSGSGCSLSPMQDIVTEPPPRGGHVSAGHLNDGVVLWVYFIIFLGGLFLKIF